VTRPGGPTAALAGRLRALGATVASRPTIALVEPTDLERPRRALAALDSYDWVLFTSVWGVRFFHERSLRCAERPPRIRGRVAAIGPATARALEDRGTPPTLTATRSDSPGLFRALEDEGLTGSSLLLVRPEVADAELPRALESLGATVDAIAFYRNVPAPGIAGIAAELCRGAYDLVLFTSPSTLDRLLEVQDPSVSDIKSSLARTRIVAIGETTAGTLRRHGLDVAATADLPGEEGLVAAVLRVVRDAAP